MALANRCEQGLGGIAEALRRVSDGQVHECGADFVD